MKASFKVMAKTVNIQQAIILSKTQTLARNLLRGIIKNLASHLRISERLINPTRNLVRLSFYHN